MAKNNSNTPVISSKEYNSIAIRGTKFGIYTFIVGALFLLFVLTYNLKGQAYLPQDNTDYDMVLDVDLDPYMQDDFKRIEYDQDYYLATYNTQSEAFDRVIGIGKAFEVFGSQKSWFIKVSQEGDTFLDTVATVLLFPFTLTINIFNLIFDSIGYLIGDKTITHYGDIRSSHDMLWQYSPEGWIPYSDGSGGWL